MCPARRQEQLFTSNTRGQHPQPSADPHPSGSSGKGPDISRPAFTDPSIIDGHVTEAVWRVLGCVLRERLDEALRIDLTFARDVAERVATFARGGKHMRSRILWWGLRACAEEPDAATVKATLRLAGSLELIQACALVHDDVMDGSMLRRGAATVHRDIDAQYGTQASTGSQPSFGSAAAVLAGDLALVWADDILAETKAPPPARAVWRAMRMEMVAGQYLDLRGKVTGPRSTAAAIRTASLKSALYSVERPLALGAALADADTQRTQALCSAGRCAGVAFQLRDDILGLFGDPNFTGKPADDDLREGKVTYLLATARASAEKAGDRAARRLLESVPGRPDLSDEEIEQVRAAVVSTGALAHVEEKIERLTSQSAHHLDGADLVPLAVQCLRELFRTAAGAPSSTTRNSPTTNAACPDGSNGP